MNCHIFFLFYKLSDNDYLLVMRVNHCNGCTVNWCIWDKWWIWMQWTGQADSQVSGTTGQFQRTFIISINGVPPKFVGFLITRTIMCFVFSRCPQMVCTQIWWLSLLNMIMIGDNDQQLWSITGEIMVNNGGMDGGSSTLNMTILRLELCRYVFRRSLDCWDPSTEACRYTCRSRISKFGKVDPGTPRILSQKMEILPLLNSGYNRLKKWL